MEHDIILDDLQLKKIRVLKMKYNAEKVQNKKINLNRDDINEMAGDNEDVDEENDGDLEDNEDELEEISDLEDEVEEIEEEADEDEDNQEDQEDNPNEDLNDLSIHESDEELSIPEEESNYDLDSYDMRTPSDESEDEKDPHGFIDPEQINTYRKKFNEKKDQLKNEEKEKYVHNRKKKVGGQTNKEKLKNKPLMMIIPKKRREVKHNGKVESMNKKIKNLKQQLGRFKRGNMTVTKKGGVTHKKKKK